MLLKRRFESWDRSRFFSLIPLLAPDAGHPDYIFLEESLAKSRVEVSEVSEGGRAPELKNERQNPQELNSPKQLIQEIADNGFSIRWSKAVKAKIHKYIHNIVANIFRNLFGDATS